MKAAKHKILFLGASHLVGLKARKIDERLRAGANRDDFEFIAKPVAVSNLQEVLHQHRSPFIVHVSAEGTEDGNIALADDAGHPQIVSDSAVVEVFKLFKIRALVFDGSHTEQLGRQLQGSVDYVVSMDGVIDGDSAIIFSSAFYQALSYGCDFDQAFKLGRNQLQIESNPDYSKPVLYHRKVIEAPRPPLEKKSVKYLSKNRRICAAGSV